MIDKIEMDSRYLKKKAEIKGFAQKDLIGALSVLTIDHSLTLCPSLVGSFEFSLLGDFNGRKFSYQVPF